MGAFYNSICVLDRHPEVVRQSLERWLAARGFVPRQGPVLFDLDGESERSAFLVSNQRWTVVFFSHYDEEWRLLQELGSLETALLYVWVYDSEVWGYDLHRMGQLAGSFNSNPWSHQSFSHLELDSKQRPAAQPEILEEALRWPGLARQLAELDLRQEPYPEDACRRFCDLIGASAAVASYDELESGTTTHLTGWRVRQLLFEHRDGAALDAAADLHSVELLRWHPDYGVEPPTGEVELPADFLAELKRMRQRRRRLLRMLRPLFVLSTFLRKLRGGRTSVAAPPALPPLATPPAATTVKGSAYRQEGRNLVNDRHGCRIELPVGAEAEPASTRPSAVFAFCIGSLHVTVSARRLRQLQEVLRRPAKAKVLVDEAYRAGELGARHLLFDLRQRGDQAEPACLGLHVLQSPVALYVFLYRSRGRPRPEEAKAVQQAAASFRRFAR